MAPRELTTVAALPNLKAILDRANLGVSDQSSVAFNGSQCEGEARFATITTPDGKILEVKVSQNGEYKITRDYGHCIDTYTLVDAKGSIAKEIANAFVANNFPGICRFAEKAQAGRTGK